MLRFVKISVFSASKSRDVCCIPDAVESLKIHKRLIGNCVYDFKTLIQLLNSIQSSFLGNILVFKALIAVSKKTVTEIFTCDLSINIFPIEIKTQKIPSSIIELLKQILYLFLIMFIKYLKLVIHSEKYSILLVTFNSSHV